MRSRIFPNVKIRRHNKAHGTEIAFQETVTMTKSFRTLLVLGFAAFAMSGLARPAAASDGLWSVLIVTEKGTCDRGYRYPVRIARGMVTHADQANSSFNIRGRVRSGSINVTVSRGSQSATGSGRIGATSATGTWRTASGDCSGTWTAEKRG
jgi:hypothetical protein